MGKRISIKYTRALVEAAVEGELDGVEYAEHPIFNIMMPVSCPHVPGEVLNPVNSWKDKGEYARVAEELKEAFEENYARRFA